MPATCPLCTPVDAGLLREELAEIYTRDMGLGRGWRNITERGEPSSASAMC